MPLWGRTFLVFLTRMTGTRQEGSALFRPLHLLHQRLSTLIDAGGAWAFSLFAAAT